MSNRRRVANLCFQTIHFLIAFGFLLFGLVEFVSNPPFFDGYGDAKASQKQLPEDLFQVLLKLSYMYFVYICVYYVYVCTECLEIEICIHKYRNKFKMVKFYFIVKQPKGQDQSVNDQCPIF